MKKAYIFLLACIALQAMITGCLHAQPVTAPGTSTMYVDDEGVMRWHSGGEELYLFGVNYAVPFAQDCRTIKIGLTTMRNSGNAFCYSNNTGSGPPSPPELEHLAGKRISPGSAPGSLHPVRWDMKLSASGWNEPDINTAKK